jgi:hypothetical protein
MSLSTIQKAHKMSLCNASWVRQLTLALPTHPVPQERCADAFKHVLKQVLAMVNMEKIWDAFKFYWMEDRT